jgi:putative membrane protein
MMRYLRYAVLVLLAVSLVTVAMANRTVVPVSLLPEGLAAFTGFGWSMELPLFLVIFAGIVAGLLIGFVLEWLRESKHRIAASENSRAAARLEREVSRLRDTKPEAQDEVLALLDKRKAG